jgi:sugar phosphate isomerase/epimerase
MKLASSSASFDAALTAGALTQLEWLDLCARELDLDGIAFDARHFPRTDDDYLAQLKKLAVDLGLTVAGLVCDVLGTPGRPEDVGSAAVWLEAARALGAPLLVSAVPAATADDPAGWNGLVAAAKAAAIDAKRCNVVLAIRNERGTLCASVADLKQLGKEVDSSWLRYAVDAAALDPPEPVAPLLPRTVITLHTADGDAADGTLAALDGVRGFLVIDRPVAETDSAPLARAIRAARRALAATLLARPE